MKVRIGVGTGAGTSGVAGDGELGAVVDKAEALGIDSLWFSEQVSSAAVDPVVGMGWAVARTTSLKVGTGVAVLPGRNPVLFAKQLASLDGLAPRRILPALGLGPARPRELSAFPVPAGRRGAVFDEALVVVRRLLTEPEVTFAGEFFTLDGVGIGERPVKPLDLWLGGAAPGALRRIGRLGDGWLASFVTPEQAASAIQTIDGAAAEAGREVEGEHFGISLPVAFGDIPGPLVEAARRRDPDVDIGAIVPVGWSAAREAIGRYVDAGISKFVVRPATAPESWSDFLERLAAELLPLEN